MNQILKLEKDIEKIIKKVALRIKDIQSTKDLKHNRISVLVKEGTADNCDNDHIIKSLLQKRIGLEDKLSSLEDAQTQLKATQEQSADEQLKKLLASLSQKSQQNFSSHSKMYQAYLEKKRELKEFGDELNESYRRRNFLVAQIREIEKWDTGLIIKSVLKPEEILNDSNYAFLRHLLDANREIAKELEIDIEGILQRREKKLAQEKGESDKEFQKTKAERENLVEECKKWIKKKWFPDSLAGVGLTSELLYKWFRKSGNKPEEYEIGTDSLMKLKKQLPKGVEVN